jgi:hypothetical protein
VPDHEARTRTTQPQYGGSDFFGFAQPPNGFGSHKGLDDVGVVILCDPCRHWCVADDSRAYRIDPDSHAGIIKRSSAREADDAEFAG